MQAKRKFSGRRTTQARVSLVTARWRSFGLERRSLGHDFYKVLQQPMVLIKVFPPEII